MRTAVWRPTAAEREVSPLELVFDLVYVFAIGKLSGHLVARVDPRTVAETVILALAVFYAWYMVAWGTNWLDPDPLPVRVALVGLMFASLLMSAAIDDALRRPRVAVRPWLPRLSDRPLRVSHRRPSRTAARRALRQQPRLGAAHRHPVGGCRGRRRRRAAAALGAGRGGRLRRRVGPALAARPGATRRP